MARGSDAGAGRLPRLAYHLTYAANWPSIERHGLLSARLLLDRAGVRGNERARLERGQRAGRVALPGGVVLNDQRPMPPAALGRCLVGLTPAEWYALLNARVFFWLDAERLARMRRASLALPHVVVTVDVERLLARHAARVALTPINTGYALRRPAPRGRHTFVPYATWLASGWASAGVTPAASPRHRAVELAVTDAVPDAMEVAVGVRRLAAGEPW